MSVQMGSQVSVLPVVNAGGTRVLIDECAALEVEIDSLKRKYMKDLGGGISIGFAARIIDLKKWKLSSKEKELQASVLKDVKLKARPPVKGDESKDYEAYANYANAVINERLKKVISLKFPDAVVEDDHIMPEEANWIELKSK